MEPINWNQVTTLGSRSYTCGSCGEDIASDKGWSGSEVRTNRATWIYVCHRCGRPTFIEMDGSRWPGGPHGEKVEHVSDAGVAGLYDEARAAYSVKSYTCVVLACRKILMHIAVAKGAKGGESYESYVNFLIDRHYVPPDAKDWIGDIRVTGNDANHEITLSDSGTAERLLDFVELLLKFIYEFPARAARGTQRATPGQ